jgi:hypothetical protein
VAARRPVRAGAASHAGDAHDDGASAGAVALSDHVYSGAALAATTVVGDADPPAGSIEAAY